MKAFITGINGFIGSHLADYLVDKMEVHGIVRNPRDDKNIKHLRGKIKTYKCDVRSSTLVKKIIGKVQPDAIYHLAAQTRPTTSWRYPVATMETNVIGTINIFEVVRKLKISPRILVACSSAEYGFIGGNEGPIKEDHQLLPLHPYGVSKVGQDLSSYQYFKNYGLDTIRLRIFGTTGFRKVGDVCSDFAREIVDIEMKKRPPIVYVGNLEVRRDLTDVRDMVRAVLLLTEKGKSGGVYNICSGNAYRIGDILDKLLKISGVDAEVKEDPNRLRPSDEPVILGDNSKIKRDCGWQPRIPIEKTLEDTLNYWRAEKGHQTARA
jgi:GDP-4-dehydro-6-deoxy-D-mannose reductase